MPQLAVLAVQGHPRVVVESLPGHVYREATPVSVFGVESLLLPPPPHTHTLKKSKT